jgi:hypothetical protein
MGRRVVALAVLAVLLPGAGSAGTPSRVDCAAAGPVAPPPASRPHYALRVHVAKSLRLVTGSLTVRFAPLAATGRIVFRLWPNAPRYARSGARLTVARVREAGRVLPTLR